jgi:transcriptional regulator with XRE-family HTH domain
MSQTKLADEVRVSQQAIADYEKGKCIPAGDTLVDLAHVLGTNSAYLIGKSESPEREDSLPIEWQAVVEDAMAQGLSPEQVRRAIAGLRMMMGMGGDGER